MHHFDAEDLKVHKAWLRRTAAVYGILLLCGGAAIATLAATKGLTATTYLAAGVVTP
jgi:hypothetical protein